jgi:hypothetical protein
MQWSEVINSPYFKNLPFKMNTSEQTVFFKTNHGFLSRVEQGSSTPIAFIGK